MTGDYTHPAAGRPQDSRLAGYCAVWK